MKGVTTNILALFSGEIVYRLIGFLSMVYLARTLGQEGFGIIQFSLAVLSYAMIASNNGLAVIGTRQIASQTNNPFEVTGTILLMRLLHAITAVFLLLIIFFLIWGYTEIFNINALYLLYLIPTALLMEWYFQGKERMVIISIGRIVGMVTYFAFILIFVSGREQILYSPVGYVIGIALNAVFLLLIYLSTGSRIRFNYDPRSWKLLWYRSVTITLSSSLAQFMLQLPPILLGFYAKYESAGIYGGAFRLISMLLVFDRILAYVFFPLVCRWAGQKDVFKEYLRRTIALVLIVALLFSLTLLFLSDLIIMLLFGQDWSASAGVLQLLTAYAGLTIINSVFSYTLLALKKEHVYFRALIWATLGGTTLMLIMISSFNEYAPVYGLIAFELIALALMNVQLREIIPLKTSRHVMILLLFAAFLGYGLIYILTWPALINLFFSLLILIPMTLYSTKLKLSDLKSLKEMTR